MLGLECKLEWVALQSSRGSRRAADPWCQHRSCGRSAPFSPLTPCMCSRRHTDARTHTGTLTNSACLLYAREFRFTLDLAPLIAAQRPSQSRLLLPSPSHPGASKWLREKPEAEGS